MRKEAGGRCAQAERGCVLEPPTPPCLRGDVADLCCSPEARRGCVTCPRSRLPWGLGVGELQSHLPLAKVEEFPNPNPKTALGLFSTSHWSGVEQGLGSSPMLLATSLLLFICEIFRVWVFQLTLASWARTKLMGTIWCWEGTVRRLPRPCEKKGPLQ